MSALADHRRARLEVVSLYRVWAMSITYTLPISVYRSSA